MRGPGTELAARGVRTDVQWQYQIAGLAAGIYAVYVSSAGFAPYTVPQYEVARRCWTCP